MTLSSMEAIAGFLIPKRRKHLSTLKRAARAENNRKLSSEKGQRIQSISSIRMPSHTSPLASRLPKAKN
jgi:hypothetical protein